jgi:hypothetical protein
MPWWSELILLLVALGLWLKGWAQSDDVVGLLLKLLGSVAFLVVLFAGHPVPLEIALLGLAIWLPGAMRFEPPSER